MTYPNAEVERYLLDHFVPVQFNVAEQPQVMERFNTPWTPTLLVFDADGKEHRRTQGYLDARRFLGELALGRLLAAINRQRFSDAVAVLPDVQGRTHGDPFREPEGLYWSAVAEYKDSGDAQRLIAGWNRLLEQFPDQEWAKRVEFIRM